MLLIVKLVKLSQGSSSITVAIVDSAWSSAIRISIVLECMQEIRGMHLLEVVLV